MATPEAQRRARAAHEKRLADAGWIKRTLRLSPDAVARIDALQASTGRPRETLVNEAILAYRLAPPVQDRVATLEAEIARLRAILNEGGLYDPELAAMAGGRVSLLEAATGKPKRFKPPVQDTKAGPESAIEGMQAERRSRERPKTLSPTLPAGDPVKAAGEPQKRLSVDVPLAGTFTRPILQKTAPKGGKR